MTAGEHSGRGYGRDDQEHPAHQDQVGGSEDAAAETWSAVRPWAHPSPPPPHDAAYGETQPPQWPAQASWPEQQAEPPDGQARWGHQDGPPSTDRYGQPAASGEPRYGHRAEDGDTGYGQSGYGDAGYGQGGYGGAGYGGAGYDEARTQAFQRPADGYGDAADGYDGSGGGSAGWSDRGRHQWKDPADESESDLGRRDGKRRGLPLWQEIPLLLVIAFCLAILVRTFLLQAFFIPSGSMEDTLLAGDRVLVNKIVYNIREPARGEVVVFQGTDAWTPQHVVDEDIGTFAKVGRTLGDLVGISHPDEKIYIKRIIGLPGDRVSCCDVDGRIFVNGEPINEDYVIHNAPLTDRTDRAQDCRSRRFEEVVVEPGQMLVLGDHRAVSQDSRCQGQVPIDNIVGRAFVIVWPTSRWTGLSAPEAFDLVPRAGGDHEVVQTDPAPTGLALVFPALLVTTMAGVRVLRVSGASGGAEPVGSRRG